MKVKLLKKVRKRYSVHFFAKGEMIRDIMISPCDIFRVTNGRYLGFSYFKTKNECLDWIMKDVRRQYGKNKYNKGIKVW